MLFDDANGTQSIASTLLTGLNSPALAGTSSSTASTYPSPLQAEDIKVKVSVHGSAALHIVDSRLAVDLSMVLTINHRSDLTGTSTGTVVNGHSEVKSLRDAVVTAESMSVLAPALHAEVRSHLVRNTYL